MRVQAIRRTLNGHPSTGAAESGCATLVRGQRMATMRAPGFSTDQRFAQQSQQDGEHLGTGSMRQWRPC